MFVRIILDEILETTVKYNICYDYNGLPDPEMAMSRI